MPFGFAVGRAGLDSPGSFIDFVTCSIALSIKASLFPWNQKYPYAPPPRIAMTPTPEAIAIPSIIFLIVG